MNRFAQVAEAQTITHVVCVQNNYNLAHRHDLIDDLARRGIALVPFFPLGGFSPLQSSPPSSVVDRLEATVMQAALPWLLHRSPNILLIPGTSSVADERGAEHRMAAVVVVDAGLTGCIFTLIWLGLSLRRTPTLPRSLAAQHMQHVPKADCGCRERTVAADSPHPRF
jgi:hypothetical protein